MRFLLLGLLALMALTGDALSGGVNNPGGSAGGGYTINWGAGLSVTAGSTGGSCSGPSACAPFASLPLKTYTTNQTLLTTDNANLILGNAAGALTLTLPSGQATNWASNICDQGAGTITVAAATGTFYPTASPSLTTGQCIFATFDGTNWAAFIAGGSGGAGTPCTTTALSVQYNNAGAFGCVSGVTSNGTLMTFAAGDLSVAGGTSGNLLIECAATCGTNTTVTFPANTGNGVSTTGALTSGHCVQFSGTAGIVADSGGACGAAAGSGVVPNYIASNWYTTVVGPMAAGGAITTGTIYAYPFYLPVKLTMNNIGVRATTAGSSNVQAAIYANNATTNRPTGTALCSTASIANTATTAPLTAACASGSLNAGIYWFEVNSGDSTVVYSAFTDSFTNTSWLIGSATVGNVLSGTSQSLNNLSLTQAFGTWPDETSSSWTEIAGANRAIAGVFEVASVP